MSIRTSGILLHPTSLPSDFGIGDLGPTAYRFADFLRQTRQRIWQILPLSPTLAEYGSSPYHSVSSFAGNPLLISPAQMIADGYLSESDLPQLPDFRRDRISFDPVIRFKTELLERAHRRFLSNRSSRRHAYENFCRRHDWLDDYALFVCLRNHCGRDSWTEWPQKLRDRRRSALASARRDLTVDIERCKFAQFLFFQQWQALKAYCNRRRIRICGDMPIYLPLDSAEVWTHPELFKLNRNKKPFAVSGVPPDYFSATGQLWGHPVYRWDVIRKTGYRWWIRRMTHQLKLFDLIRIDHFRGLVAYWEVPARAETAVKGKWVPAPAEDLFFQMAKAFGTLPVIAEDLGTITADVRETMAHFGFPGMRVLQFAFGDDFPDSVFLPHRHVRNCVVYTGTHDNNTTRGWFEAEAAPTVKQNLFRYLGAAVPAAALPREMIRLAMMSVAETAVIPMQDVLGLGVAARMNQPAGKADNWRWRLAPDYRTDEVVAFLGEMTQIYGRD
jgi:4-alpha-glucanotransferase